LEVFVSQRIILVDFIDVECVCSIFKQFEYTNFDLHLTPRPYNKGVTWVQDNTIQGFVAYSLPDLVTFLDASGQRQMRKPEPWNGVWVVMFVSYLPSDKEERRGESAYRFP
jgi:hypothetical protein